MQLSGIGRVLNALQIGLAGMTIPVVAGELFGLWRRADEHPARRPMAGGLLAAGLVLVSNAVVLEAQTIRVAEAALLVRAVALSVLAVAIVEIASRLAAHRPPAWLEGVVAVLAAARIGLWLGTDLMYAHRFENGSPVYGPLLPFLNGALLAFAFGYVVRAGVSRRAPRERSALLAGVVGSTTVALLALAVPKMSWSELLSGYSVVPVLVALYAVVALRLLGLADQRQRLADRDARLAQLGRAVLTVPLDALADHAAAAVRQVLEAEQSEVAFGSDPLRDSLGDAAALAVAIEGRNGVVGRVSATRDTPFDDSDSDFLKVVATLMAMGHERARLSDAMRDEAFHDEVLTMALTGAVTQGEIVAHYQPIFDLESGRVTHVEALARWQRGSTLRLPGEWIPAAERTGVIGEIGCAMLRVATADLRHWLVGNPDLGMTVNVSPRQLADGGELLLRCLQAVLDAGTPPDRLWLEITESHRVEDAAVEAVRAVRALGCRIVLDDFGVGYSSLAALARIPVDVVKIDREFIAALGTPNGRDLVAALITLADRLGLEVVAEGIETADQRDALTSLGCRKGQGFLLAPPVPADELVLVAGWA